MTQWEYVQHQSTEPDDDNPGEGEDDEIIVAGWIDQNLTPHQAPSSQSC